MNTGTITHINPSNGMFIVRFDDGPHSVYELLDSIDITIGDQVRCKLNALGPQEAFHLDQRQSFQVSGESGECGLNAAFRLIRR